MTRILAIAAMVTLSACATNNYEASQTCARTAGCTSSFSNSGYGPVHAQAVAPDSPSPLQPQL